jgi:hypothetical protein
MEVLDRGVARVTAERCTGEGCAGPFALIGVGEEPRAPVDPEAPTVVRLREGQEVEVVLRFKPEKERYEVPARNVPYTAILLYSSESPAEAIVEATDEAGAWVEMGSAWEDTGGKWRWLQVWPVFAATDGESGGQPVLRLRVKGSASNRAPSINLAGFVSDEPWCREGEAKMMKVCKVKGKAGASFFLPRVRH